MKQRCFPRHVQSAQVHVDFDLALLTMHALLGPMSMNDPSDCP